MRNYTQKICILTSVHPPFDTRIFHKEAQSLVKAGYNVTLIAQHEKEEIVDGVKIISMPTPSSRIVRMTKTVWTIFRKARNVDADIYHFHDLELNPICLLLKLCGKKVIYDVHEDYAASISDNHRHWLPPYLSFFLAFCASIMERFSAYFFDAIVAATDQIGTKFPRSKTVVINNYPICGELEVTTATPYLSRPHDFVYIGAISKLRGINEMKEAMKILPTQLRAKLQLAGIFDTFELQNNILDFNRSDTISYWGSLSRSGVASILNKTRAGLVLFHPAQNHIKAQPNKLFEYLSAGIPVIASDFPLWRRIVDGEGCGLLVDPLNPMAIADAMRWVLEHPTEAEAMGQRGRKAIEQIYNWNIESIKLVGLYKKLLGR